MSAAAPLDVSRLQLLPLASSFRGPLSPGCTQCAEGKKMVLFVTGLCRFRCFYCPVSERRNQKDVTYANERLVTCDEDLLAEAEAMGAEGTGVTGGDPLGAIDRTVHYVELLKSTYGPKHHIHLYTHEPNPAKFQRLAEAGLDEIRLHIPHYLWGSLSGGDGSAYRKVLEDAPSWGLRRGVEIPVLPEKGAELRALLRTLGRIGVDFVNLNEMEMSETNEVKMHARGYRVDRRAGWGIKGSRALAEAIVREGGWAAPVHYCSSRFKDGVQLRERLKRRAIRTSAPFVELTSDGTVVKGIVELPPGGTDLDALRAEVADRLRITETHYRLDRDRRRLEVDPARLRAGARRLRLPAFLVEEYPTADALEVERTPLNRAAFPRRIGTGG